MKRRPERYTQTATFVGHSQVSMEEAVEIAEGEANTWLRMHGINTLIRPQSLAMYCGDNMVWFHHIITITYTTGD